MTYTANSLHVFTCSLKSYPSGWQKCSILSLQCLYMIPVITNCKIQLDVINPHFTKLQISQWSTFDRRVQTLQHWAQWTCWWSNMYRSETAFCHKKFTWWPGIGSWIASFRIPIISITRDGLFVKCIDWSLLYIEQHPDNLRKITLQMI